MHDESVESIEDIFDAQFRRRFTDLNKHARRSGCLLLALSGRSKIVYHSNKMSTFSTPLADSG
jgi:hypothetical protein